MVLPFRSFTLLIAVPFSRMYSTPSVLTASIFTLPFVLAYRADARLVGTAAISASPLATLATASSGVDSTEKV